MRIVATLDRGVTLLVGLDDAPPAPIQIGSPETGDFRGYEVDLLRNLARRLNVQLRYRRALWSTLIRELASGRLDIICSAATVTEDRRREVDFCRPHLALPSQSFVGPMICQPACLCEALALACGAGRQRKPT
jgi:ABC-type amino acid transport substrate-binding protein